MVGQEEVVGQVAGQEEVVEEELNEDVMEEQADLPKEGLNAHEEELDQVMGDFNDW